MGIKIVLERKTINIRLLGQKPIIVPVDFSVKSKKAFFDAVRMASFLRVKVGLIYVLENTSELEKEIVLEQGVRLRQVAYEALNTWIADCPNKDVEILPIVDAGKIYERIIDLVSQTNAFLVWMATNGSGEKKSRYLGSNALKVIKTAGIPVVTSSLVSSEKILQRVLLPLDLSVDFSDKIKTLAKFILGFEMKLMLSIVSIVPDSDEFQINRLSQRLSDLKELLIGTGISYSLEIVKTVSANETLVESVFDYARKMEAGMIIITSQQDTNFSQFYLSPLLQEIISYSDIPVLTISPQKYLTLKN